MPNMKWSELSPLQLGRYAEYYAKMEFASYGFEVYTSEVDDHGVDFVAKHSADSSFYEVQVKAVRNYNYTGIAKSKWRLESRMLLCYLRFEDGHLPDVYVIPATVWLVENEVFKSYTDKSADEWGVNISKKNLPILEQYVSDRMLPNLTP